MRSLALLVAVVVAAPAAAQSSDAGSQAKAAPDAPAKAAMLIWDGGATREEADSALQAWSPASLPVLAQLELAKGYPRVLESKTVPGLKPGFWVVVLGVCAPGKEAQPLAALKALEPKIYTREVQWTEPLACPQKAEDWSWPQVRVVKKKGRELTVSVYSMQHTYEGGEFEDRSWKAIGVLRDAKARLLDMRSADSQTGAWAEVKSIAERPDGVALSDEWASPGCYGAPSSDIYARTAQFKIKGDAIDFSQDDEHLRSIECGKYYP